jgi:hypothetical protein
MCISRKQNRLSQNQLQFKRNKEATTAKETQNTKGIGNLIFVHGYINWVHLQSNKKHEIYLCTQNISVYTKTYLCTQNISVYTKHICVHKNISVYTKHICVHKTYLCTQNISVYTKYICVHRNKYSFCRALKFCSPAGGLLKAMSLTIRL